MLRGFFIVIIALGSWGCRGPQNSDLSFAGLELPATFGSGTTNAPAGAGWLVDFQDSTLHALVREALSNNPDLRVTAAKLETAQANAAISGTTRTPTLSVRAQASRTKRNSASGFKIVSSRNNRFSPTLELAWEADVWGRLGDTARAARLDAEAAAANLHAARLSLAANTAKGWFNLTEAELQLQLASQTYRSYTNNLAVLEDALQRGLSKALDVRLMRTSVRNAENTVQLRLRERDGARRSLEVLLGRYPRSELALADELPKLATAVPAGLPAQLLERRPDIRAAQANFFASHQRVNAAQKERLPQISLTSSAGTSTDELKDVLDVNNNIWSLAANLTKPIFDGGKIRAQIDRAKAQREEARHAYVQAALQAFAEVETALAAEKFLTAQSTALAASVEESTEAEELAQDDYLAGLADIVTVLESQRRVFDARRALLELQNLRLQNRIDLYLALGGEFAQPPADEQ